MIRLSSASLMALLVVSPLSEASGFGYFATHVATYTAAGVASHEIGRSLDGRNTAQASGSGEAVSRVALPDPRYTPGAINPDVTQDNLDQTICRRGGYTKSIRPPESYTYHLKMQGIRQYGYSDHRARDYEEDHLVSLEIGGSPTDPKNLWPEAHNVEGGWGSYTKDKLENRLHELVCRRQIPLAVAQNAEAHNWIAAYKQYVGPTP